jgi:hypothetical protein
MTDRDIVSLFARALDVINSALAEHEDSMPYEGLLRASETVLGNRRIGVAVYESDPWAPFDYFTIRFRHRRFELVSHGKRETDLVWRVSPEYLEEVAENAREYIENPVKLDWDWLKGRVGVESLGTGFGRGNP